ncbi:unnamed protein product, partial [Allacma fusca]
MLTFYVTRFFRTTRSFNPEYKKPKNQFWKKLATVLHSELHL